MEIMWVGISALYNNTTIQVPAAYAKAELTISAGLQFANTASNVYQNENWANYARRDTVFTFEF